MKNGVEGVGVSVNRFIRGLRTILIIPTVAVMFLLGGCADLSKNLQQAKVEVAQVSASKCDAGSGGYSDEAVVYDISSYRCISAAEASDCVEVEAPIQRFGRVPAPLNSRGGLTPIRDCSPAAKASPEAKANKAALDARVAEDARLAEARAAAEQRDREVKVERAMWQQQKDEAARAEFDRKMAPVVPEFLEQAQRNEKLSRENCPSGYDYDNGFCVGRCPSGYQSDGGYCVK